MGNAIEKLRGEKIQADFVREMLNEALHAEITKRMEAVKAERAARARA